MADAIEDVLATLARNVEVAVHSLYRGEVRQATAKARTGHLVREAAEALRMHAGDSFAVPAPTAPGAPGRASAILVTGAAVGWRREEGEAVMKCVMAWLPMGSPAGALPDSRCIAAGREMVPTWGDRERARAALNRITAV